MFSILFIYVACDILQYCVCYFLHMIRSLAIITINKIICLILIILLTEKCDNIIKTIY